MENKKLGNVVITGEEKKKGSKTIYKMIFEANNFAPESIFYRLSKLGHNQEYIPFVESETCPKTKGSTKHLFNEIEIPSSDLIHDDENKKAQIEIFQWYAFTI